MLLGASVFIVATLPPRTIVMATGAEAAGTIFPRSAGASEGVERNRSSVAARLECAMTDGDYRIFPIAGEADLSPNIRFVAKNSSEPAFDILTYRVTP